MLSLTQSFEALYALVSIVVALVIRAFAIVVAVTIAIAVMCAVGIVINMVFTPVVAAAINLVAIPFFYVGIIAMYSVTVKYIEA